MKHADMSRTRTRCGRMGRGLQTREQQEEESPSLPPDDSQRSTSSTSDGQWRNPRSAGRAPPWTYGGRERSILGEPTVPRKSGRGFYPGVRQEAYNAELIAIMKGLHHLASQHGQGRDSAILTDSQATMRRLQNTHLGPDRI